MDSASDTGSMPVWTVPGYRHERELGSGATGRVVLARHEATGTPVAIKYLVRQLHSAPDFRSAYRSEAVLLGELQSPHVARLYEYVEADQGAAIVMELVEGIALRDLLRNEGATTPEAALVILKGSLLGLAAAHEAGVVHRDYKPENVLVTAQGSSKLVDFGIAARSGEVGAAAGTPLYMAPEQFSGEPAQPPTDVYAATATFFECVTGSRPYSGTTVMELMIQHTQSPIPDDQAPEHVRSLIRTGLAKAPQDRPPSATAFVEALEDAARVGYGEDWEERGQRKLATLVAMLPLLLLSAAPDIASATTSLATTDLGSGSPPPPPTQGPEPAPEPPKSPHHPHDPHHPNQPPPSRHHHHRHRLTGRVGKALIGSIAAGLTIGGIAAVAAASGGGGTNAAGPGTVAAGYGATSGATTSVAPQSSTAAMLTTPSASTTQSPSPSASASTSASPTPSTSSSALPGTSATTTAAPSDGSSSPTTSVTNTSTSTPTPAPSSSASPASTASAPPPPPPTLHVRSVSITSFGCSGNHWAAATVQVQSDGAAPGTLTLTWYYTDPNGAQHTVETVPVTIPQGQTNFVNATPYYYDFGTEGVYWGLTVSTTPAAARGNNSTSTVLAASCEIS